jgi:hypothetical protein
MNIIKVVVRNPISLSLTLTLGWAIGSLPLGWEDICIPYDKSQ